MQPVLSAFIVANGKAGFKLPRMVLRVISEPGLVHKSTLIMSKKKKKSYFAIIGSISYEVS